MSDSLHIRGRSTVSRVREPASPASPLPAMEPFTLSEIERVTGSRTIPGNRLQLQFEGSSSFEGWLDAIAHAERFVYFENYVVRDDAVGRRFRDALVAKAKQGVPVKVAYDWVGCWATPGSYWRPYHEAGVDVRAFNPPALRLGDPFGGLQRDHRKLVAVDGAVAFVGGFCVGEEWAGTASEPPWRDTGVEIRGPAAKAAAETFERLWSRGGEPLALAASLPDPEPVGETSVWIIEGEPGRARVYRTLHLTAVRARERLWITDAYFVAPRPVSEALGAAAQAGVDVRILLPSNNNWPLVGSISRGGYRYLLEAGVRLFEWQGAMMHAKTVVADGRWSRVGSSNLNAASLLGNWEIDVGVLDEGFANQMEGLFMADLASSVEIVLPGRRGVRPVHDVDAVSGETRVAPLDPSGTLRQRLSRELRARGRARISTAPLLRVGAALGDALAGNRPLGREDRAVLGTLSVVILLFAGIAALVPTLVGWAFALVAAWFGATTGVRAYLQSRLGRRGDWEAPYPTTPHEEDR